MNQSTCAGETVNFTCVVMFTSGSPGPAGWFTNNGNNDASREPGHTLTDDSNGRSASANVTTVFTVTNVSISDNGADYVCTQGRFEASDTVYLTVFGRLTSYRLSSAHYLAMYYTIFICTCTMILCTVHSITVTEILLCRHLLVLMDSQLHYMTIRVDGCAHCLYANSYIHTYLSFV